MAAPSQEKTKEPAMTAAELEDLSPGLGELLGAEPGMPDRREYLVFLTLSVVVVVGLLSYLGYIYFKPYVDKLYLVVKDQEKVRRMWEAASVWGPVVYILLVAAKTVIFFIPFPIDFAGGFLYGLPLGMLYTTTGLTLGSTIAFLLGRLLEERVTGIIGQHKLKRLRRFMREEGAVTAWVIMMAPAVPKDGLCYLMGMTRMSLKFFLVAVTLVRLPVTALQTLQGVEVFQGNQVVNISLIIANLVAAVLAFRYRKHLYKWLKQWYQENNSPFPDKIAG